MTTRDRKATTSIRYVTLGWTLKREEKSIEKTDCVRVKLEQYTDSVPDPNNSAYVYSYFRIGKEDIYSRIVECSPEWAQELYQTGGMLYLDGIMTIQDGKKYRGSMDADGTFHGTVYETQKDIVEAEAWGDPSALATHFNKAVYFPGNPTMLEREPEQVEVVEKVCNGSLMQEKDLPSVNQLYLTSSDYEVTKAIPSGEKVSFDASLAQYFYNATFYHHSGYVKLPITAKVSYTLVWNDGVQHEEKVTVTEFYDVTRTYSYWKFAEVELYYLNTCELENAALSTTKSVQNEKIPTVTTVQEQNAYVKFPDTTVELEGGVVNGGSNRPYIPYQTSAEKVERAIPEIQVNNDGFAIDGISYLKEGWQTKETEGPTSLVEEQTVTFEEKEIQLPAITRNGAYHTKVTAHYQLYGGEEEKIVAVTKTNDIFVHTPVVCVATISDEKKYNQQVTPTTYPSLILGRSFAIKMSAAGAHIKQKGYGTQDYDRFTTAYQVCFPFDVYYDTQYIQKGNWISVTPKDAVFVLPETVAEGDYVVTCRTLALNSIEPAALEDTANLDPNYDAAAKQITVTVVGRLFDFKITNIIDYPRWQSVFWKAGILERTNLFYYAGTNDFNGVRQRAEDSQFLCPILKGSHPYQKNAGPVGLGYQVEFEVTTLGRRFGMENGLELTPTFYHVSKDGTQRQQVRLYFKETLEEITMPFSLLYSNTNSTSNAWQKWTGTCQVPPDLYVVPAQLNLKQYLQQRGGRISTRDSVFLQGGYLIVNTAFTSYQGVAPNLSYQNSTNAKNGYCDMWKMQGYQTQRVDSEGTCFLLEEGDTFVFDLTNTILTDYVSMGTH